MVSILFGAYKPVDSELDKGETDSFLLEQSARPSDDCGATPPLIQPRPWLLTAVPWFLSAVFATLSLFLLMERDSRAALTPFGSYESGFDTDIIPPERIPLELVRFTRSPHFHANGTGYVDPVDETAPWPENMVLFGPPSPEIDANWGRLIGKRYFSISEEEATRAWGDKRHEYVDQRQGGYTAGLDVFHTLHCVNALRKALHPEYYRHGSHQSTFHMEHCLDAIRQSVQCYGSTTLIPTRFREGLHHNYIDSDQAHVCRSFTFLRDFSTSRARGHENYVERDRSLVDERQHAIAAAWMAARNRYRHGHH